MDDLVLYQGRMIPRKGFRAFIYNKEHQSRLVNSWDEFEQWVDNVTWFSSKEETSKDEPKQEIEQKKAQEPVLEQKKRGRPKAGA